MKNNSNVVFLYISVDKDPEAWQRSIKKHGIEGVHLLASEQWAKDNYSVYAYPMYFLIV